MKLLRILSGKDLDEINEFLGELKDGVAYKKRLKALEDQKKEINDLIEVYGKANDIDRIRSNALRDEEQATKNLDAALADREDAKLEASGIIHDAKVGATATTARANKQFADRERALTEGEAALGQREKAHARSLDDLESRERKAEQMREAGILAGKTYRDAVAALKTAIEQIAKAL